MTDQLVASLVDGLLLGAIYGLTAMGLNLIWGVMRVINLSHGAIMMLGMFATYALFSQAGINPYWALPFVAAGGFAFGFVLYWTSVHRLINAPHLSTLLSTFAVNMILIGIGTAVFTSSPRNIDFSTGSASLGSVVVQGSRLTAAGLAVLFSIALYLFLNKTFLGKSIRAVADNRVAAELMGIPSSRVLAISFGIGCMLASTAGLLLSSIFPFTVLSGGVYETKAFVICVLGGLGNPMGALLGGILIGAMEGVIPAFLPVEWTAVLEFLLFVVVLIVRPTGLLGVK